MNCEYVQALSVRELVRRRCGDDDDVWHLALVQRGVVWDHVRMRYLLDSLLAGYPIGSLLLCKVAGGSNVIRVQAGQRVVGEADRDSWQLLDGQQRINSLFSIFTPEGRYGRFYLHMTARRDPPSGPVTRRRARDISVRYIHWQEETEVGKVITNRDRYIDLSRWYAWAEGNGHAAIEEADVALASDRDKTVRILNAIDSDFADEGELTDDEIEIATDRLRRLRKVWRDKAIPVHYLQLGSPYDVLEVFTRINRAGVQVAGEDLFFAAVKTLWSEAEQTVARVPYRPQRNVFDWDHIFPQAQAKLMWSPGPEGKWRRHHKYRRFVGCAGNLWGLDAGTNRAVQDLLPDEKFEKIEKWLKDGDRPVWPTVQWALKDEEVRAFREIGCLLQRQVEIDQAMNRFHDIVRSRAIRMTDEVFAMLPDAKLFSADTDLAGAESSPPPQIAGALGITITEQVQPEHAAGATVA